MYAAKNSIFAFSGAHPFDRASSGPTNLSLAPRCKNCAFVNAHTRERERRELTHEKNSIDIFLLSRATDTTTTTLRVCVKCRKTQRETFCNNELRFFVIKICIQKGGCHPNSRISICPFPTRALSSECSFMQRESSSVDFMEKLSARASLMDESDKFH